MAEEPTSPTGEPEGGSNEPENTPPRTYTQDELDRIVAQRVQKSKAQFKDYDQYKQAAQRLEDIESSQRSEAEKLLSAIDKANKQAQEASEREKAATERANSTLIRAAVISEAASQRAVDPQAVYALLNDSPHKAQIQLGDDDRVEGVSEAVKALLEERTYLVGNRPNGGFDGGPRQTAPAQSSNADLNDAIRRQAGFA